MKILILKYIENVDDNVSFKIVEQTHRCNDFGNGDNTFRTSRGINLSSVLCPDISLSSPRVFYCRGEDIGSDDNIVTATITITEWEEIKVAVREYNEYFEYFGECIIGDPNEIIGDPDEIIGDIVPKEMFMVD